MSICIVSSCQNKSRKTGKSVKYHRFPKDKELCKVWAEKCNYIGQVHPINSVVCSTHFTADDYERDLQAELMNLPLKRILKNGAVPSLLLPPPDIVPQLETGAIENCNQQSQVNGEFLPNNEANLETGHKVFIVIGKPMMLNNCISGTVLTEAQFPQLCRSCLSRSDNTSIFKLNFEGLDFRDIFETCCAVKIAKDDGLPQNICQKCINDIVYIYKFMIKCKESDSVLRAILGKVDNVIVENIKAEPNDNEESTSSAPLSENIDYQSGEKPVNNCNTEDVTKKKKKLNNQEKNITITCANCDYTVDTYRKLTKHCRQTGHVVPKRYKCEHCEKFFISPSKVAFHMKAVHLKKKPYECEICGFKFAGKFTLRRHMKTHTETKPHVCEICGIGFCETSSLKNHLRKHSGEKPFICSHCGKGFTNPGVLKWHERKHKVQDILNEKVGTSLVEEAAKHPDLFDKVCTICGKVFSSKYVLRQHLLMHQDIYAYLCSECGKRFATKTGLENHSVVHTGIKPYTCEICHKSFAQLSTLNTHRVIHKEEKPYKCQICPRDFKLKAQLNRHMIMHSGKKAHACNFCDKKFAWRENMKAHLRVHTGEAPYACDVCGKRFHHSNNRKKHRRVHDSVKDSVK